MATGFKQTEIGMIPEDWDVKKLGDIVKVTKGQQITEKTAVPDGIPVIGGGMTVSYYHNKPNRTGVTITVSASGAYAGYVSIHNYPIFASDCSTIQQSKEHDIYFLYYALLNKQKEIFSLQTGGGQPHVYPQQLKNLLIPLPPLAEQTAIARVLSDADALIQKLEQLIAKKRNLKTAAMQELLKPKEDWEVKKLGEVAIIEKGEQLNRETLKENDVYPVYNGGISPSGYTDKFNTEANSIIISEGGNSCGYVNFINERFWRGGHCYLVKTHLNKTFIYQMLKSLEQKIMSLRVGSGLPNIQRGRLLDFEIYIPKSKSEQTRIAQILSNMDNEIEALEKQLEKYKRLKQGMMQSLLTGKIRLV